MEERNLPDEPLDGNLSLQMIKIFDVCQKFILLKFKF